MTLFPLSPSLTHLRRAYAYAPACGVFFGGVLLIVQGEGDKEESDVYAVEEFHDELTTDFCLLPPLPPHPRYWLLCKCDADASEKLYLVRISQGAGIRDSCQCYGFNRWGVCKHIDTLSDLLRRKVF